MAPAIDHLVTATEEMNSRQAHGSEDALRSLIEEFTKSVSKEGDHQREALTGASVEVRNAMGDLSTKMTGFLESLDSQQSALRSDQEKRSLELEANFAAAIEQQKEMVEYVRNSVGGQVNAAESLLKQGESLGANVQRSSQVMDNVGSHMEQVTEKLKEISGYFEGASGTLGDAIVEASKRVSQSSDIAARLIDENAKLETNVNKVVGLLDSVKQGVVRSTEQLNVAANTARDGYVTVSQGYRDLQNELKNHVSELEEQLSNLLRNYGAMVNEQTTERLSEWDKQTKNYTEVMSRAVEAIGSVVDEFEGKVRPQ